MITTNEELECDVIYTSHFSPQLNQMSSQTNIQCFECSGNHRNMECPIVHERWKNYNRRPRKGASLSIQKIPWQMLLMWNARLLLLVLKSQLQSKSQQYLKNLPKTYDIEHWQCMQKKFRMMPNKLPSRINEHLTLTPNL